MCFLLEVDKIVLKEGLKFNFYVYFNGNLAISITISILIMLILGVTRLLFLCNLDSFSVTIFTIGI